MKAKSATSGIERTTGCDLIDEAPLHHLGMESYWALIQVVCNEVMQLTPSVSPDDWSLHEKAFARYALLITSPLGGFCWPGAERSICSQTYGQVAHMLDGEKGKLITDFVIERRKGLDYPIFVAPIVQYALLLLVVQRMRVRPVRNNALLPLAPSDYLAPVSRRSRVDRPDIQLKYRLGLITRYLQLVAAKVELSSASTLKDFLAVGRFLLIYQYDVDVTYATLGALATRPPDRPALSDPMFLNKLAQPIELWRK